MFTLLSDTIFLKTMIIWRILLRAHIIFGTFRNVALMITTIYTVVYLIDVGSFGLWYLHGTTY